MHIITLLSALLLILGLLYAGRIRTIEAILSFSALGIACAVYFICGMSSDPYGTFHLALNRLPGDPPEGDPRTEWLNMGYWRDADVFPEACEALARKVIEAAEYQEGDNVLDVGHGSGESLILQLSYPSVPRPSSLTGITSLPAHHRRSFDRIVRLREEAPDLKCNIRLYEGDAVYRSDAKEHPLDPASEAAPYDRILALDCAYHFRTRSEFLEQSLVRLAPGGRIALADICFASLDKWTARTLIALFSPMPKENVITSEEYVRKMQIIGYRDVRLEDITDDVFPGFQTFLRSRGGLWRIFACFMGLLARNGARFVIVTGAKGMPCDAAGLVPVARRHGSCMQFMADRFLGQLPATTGPATSLQPATLS